MVMLKGIKIGIIGGGTMGQALIKGLLDKDVSAENLFVAEGRQSTIQRLKRRFRIFTTSDLNLVVQRSDILILAVKPQQIEGVLGNIKGKVKARQLVISIAAGITIRLISRYIKGRPIIRVMPNLSATVGLSFSAIAKGSRVSPNHLRVARSIFNTVGQVVELQEKYFDAITAVSGSGPAYLFFLVASWLKAANKLGLKKDIAEKAVMQTLRGSITMLETQEKNAAELIVSVKSKHGTTEAALIKLKKLNVENSIVQAIKAAARRSRELSR